MPEQTSQRVFQVVKGVKGDPDASILKISICKPGTTATPKQLTSFSNNLDESFTVMGVSRGGTDFLALDLALSTGTADANELFVYGLATRRRGFAYSPRTSSSTTSPATAAWRSWKAGT